MESIMQTGMSREENLNKQKELQRQDEHLKLLKWISDNEDSDFPFRIVTKSEWNRFYNSEDEDDEMNMISVECDKFFERFKEITGVNLLNISNFISMSYIDGAQNDIEIVVGNNEIFIIGV